MSNDVQDKSNATFSKKKAYFLKKSKIIPSSIIYDLNLTSDALRLILALNALPEIGWTINQKDIQNRLDWSKKRMWNAIRSSREAGYMVVKQSRREGGRFNSNDFEFDLHPNYLNSGEESEKLKEKVPRTHLRCTAKPRTVKEPLSVLPRSESVLEEQTNKLEKTEEVLFVCSSIEDYEEKMKLLEKYDLGKSILEQVLPKSLGTIQNALKAYHQYAEKNPVANEKGCIRNAILLGWGKNKGKKELLEEKQLEAEKFDERFNKNRDHCRNWEETYRKNFTREYSFSCGNHTVYLKTGDSSVPLWYGDPDCITILAYFINNNL